MNKVKNTLLAALVIFSVLSIVCVTLPGVDAAQGKQAAGPKITYEQAIEIAVKAAGGGQVKDVDLEYSNWRGWVYEVEVVKDFQEIEVYIDGETGEVLKVKRD